MIRIKKHYSNRCQKYLSIKIYFNFSYHSKLSNSISNTTTPCPNPMKKVATCTGLSHLSPGISSIFFFFLSSYSRKLFTRNKTYLYASGLFTTRCVYYFRFRWAYKSCVNLHLVIILCRLIVGKVNACRMIHISRRYLSKYYYIFDAAHTCCSRVITSS